MKIEEFRECLGLVERVLAGGKKNKIEELTCLTELALDIARVGKSRWFSSKLEHRAVSYGYNAIKL